MIYQKGLLSSINVHNDVYWELLVCNYFVSAWTISSISLKRNSPFLRKIMHNIPIRNTKRNNCFHWNNKQLPTNYVVRRCRMLKIRFWYYFKMEWVEINQILVISNNEIYIRKNAFQQKRLISSEKKEAKTCRLRHSLLLLSFPLLLLTQLFPFCTNIFLFLHCHEYKCILVIIVFISQHVFLWKFDIPFHSNDHFFLMSPTQTLLTITSESEYKQ